MVIAIKPVSLSNQKITEDKGCELHLNEDHVKYIIRFQADEPKDMNDHDLGWESAPSDFEIIALKKNIAGIEKALTLKPRRWQIAIIVTGFANDLKLYFLKQEEAQDIFDKIQTYLLDGNKD